MFYPDWRTAELGETVVYEAADGRSAIYTVESIVDNEPYVAVGDFDAGGINCSLDSVHELRPDGEAHLLEIDYGAAARNGIEPQNQALSALVTIKLPNGDVDPSIRGISLVDIARLNDSESDDYRQRHYPARVLANGREYVDVIESTELPGNDLFDDPDRSPFALRRFAFARGFGLVEFERLNGDVFTRVDGR